MVKKDDTAEFAAILEKLKQLQEAGVARAKFDESGNVLEVEFASKGPTQDPEGESEGEGEAGLDGYELALRQIQKRDFGAGENKPATKAESVQ